MEPEPKSVAKQHYELLLNRVAETQDKAAFTQLFNYFAPRLNSYFLRIGSTKSEAEELVQEVMIILWNKAELFDPAKSSLTTWLFRIARNRRIDALRRNKSRNLETYEFTLNAEDYNIERVIDAQMRDQKMQLFLKKLPQEQFILIEMSFLKGYSHSQIAKQTGLPLGTVKSRIRLAFTRLRNMIEKEDKIDF